MRFLLSVFVVQNNSLKETGWLFKFTRSSAHLPKMQMTQIYLGIRQKELTLMGMATENAKEMEEWEEAVKATREGRLDVEAVMTLT